MYRKYPAQQKGAALLTLILLIIAGSAWMLLENLNATAIQNQRDEHDARILAEAKEALIAYAITHGDLDTTGEYGFLPCPDRYGGGAIDEGGSDGNCGADESNTLGRLPWRSLGLEPLKDSAGECLWYAVSSQYHGSDSVPPELVLVNADTNGTFEIYSSTTGDLLAGAGAGDDYGNRPVAVVFSAGEPLGNQDREEEDPAETPECGGNYYAVNYLDEINLGGSINTVENHALDAIDDINNIASGVLPDGTEFNDKIVYITKKDIWDAIKERKDIDYVSYPEPQEFKKLTQWLSGCLIYYAEQTGDDSLNYTLPYPASPNLISDISIRDYRDANLYESIDPSDLSSFYLTSYSNPPLFGRFPYDVKNSSDIKNSPSLVGNLIEECDVGTYGFIDDEIKDNQDRYKRMWQQWKDHFFYAVAELYQPADNWERIPDPDNNVVDFCNSLPRPDWPGWLNDWFFDYCEDFIDDPALQVPVTCDSDNCITIEDESGRYFAAVVMFAGHKHDSGYCDLDTTETVGSVSQERHNFSIDTDKIESNDVRKRTCNYLEYPNLDKFVGRDNNNYIKYSSSSAPLILAKPSPAYKQSDNDIYYCIEVSNLAGVNNIVNVTDCFGRIPDDS